MTLIILLPLLLFTGFLAADEERPLNVLHLTFHRGCAHEFNQVAEILGLDVETWFIPDLPPKFFDGCSQGNVLYSMGHGRADDIWNKHKEAFAKFDIILTSDTAPLSRIFLQHNYQKPLVIWICNRFDYCDETSRDCDFPDPEFYQLFNEANQKDHVTVIAYTPFEHYYAKSKGVETGSLLITPCAPLLNKNKIFTKSAIPSEIDRVNSFFLPPYHNERFFMDLSAHCAQLGIPNYCGRYNGALDLKDFKGIVHLPYSWSNLALFENLTLGMTYFVPSVKFFQSLTQEGDYFHPNLAVLLNEQLFTLSEWYLPERENILIYFDSWEDLKCKIDHTDYEAQKNKVLNYIQKYQSEMLNRWRQVFNRYRNFSLPLADSGE